MANLVPGENARKQNVYLTLEQKALLRAIHIAGDASPSQTIRKALDRYFAEAYPNLIAYKAATEGEYQTYWREPVEIETHKES